MQHIGSYLKKNEKQIFMTTHNPATLDSLDLFDEDIRLFAVKRASKGFTVFERIQPPPGTTKDDWREKFQAQKLSEIWLSGALGALNERV